MRKFRIAALGLLAAAVLGLAGFGAWLALLPPAPTLAAPAPIAAEETEATLAALRPARRERPVIAVLGINDATETTDYVMPYGILKRADVAEVVALATGPGPVNLYPALKVEPDETTAEFDARHPDGADYVIVPAMTPDDDPAALVWLQAQAARGAVVIGVCAGAKVVAAAGLLADRRGTTHWYYLDALRDRAPTLRYVPDRRFLVDGKVVTTTGISASMPMTLTLIEAIAGRDKAEQVAETLGLSDWDARHASDAFRFNRPFALTAAANTLAFWNRERLGLALEPGMDEVSLALVADAWSRTYRSRALTLAGGPVATRSGLRVIPDGTAEDTATDTALPGLAGLKPKQALDGTLADIARRYGERTASVVAMQLEYPRPAAR